MVSSHRGPKYPSGRLLPVGDTTVEFLGGVLTGLPLTRAWSLTGSLTIGGTDYSGSGVTDGNVALGVTNAFAHRRRRTFDGRS